MIAYLDSSVVLRIVLGHPGRLREWNRITMGVASGLIEVECLRTIDRLHLAGHLTADVTAVRREAVYVVMETLELADLTPRSYTPSGPANAGAVGNSRREFISRLRTCGGNRAA